MSVQTTTAFIGNSLSDRERARRAQQSELSLMQADELREILGGVSDMWVWRRLKDGTLPRPLMISKRRFWKRGEIVEYIERYAAARLNDKAA